MEILDFQEKIKFRLKLGKQGGLGGPPRRVDNFPARALRPANVSKDQRRILAATGFEASINLSSRSFQRPA